MHQAWLYLEGWGDIVRKVALESVHLMWVGNKSTCFGVNIKLHANWVWYPEIHWIELLFPFRQSFKALGKTLASNLCSIPEQSKFCSLLLMFEHLYCMEIDLRQYKYMSYFKDTHTTKGGLPGRLVKTQWYRFNDLQSWTLEDHYPAIRCCCG